jgi:general secretion pathway protein D
VQGQITLQTNRPVRRDAVIPLLEEVLRINGVGLLRVGDTITVAPLAEVARRGPTLSRPEGPQAGAIMRILQLQHIAPDEVALVVRALLPQDVVLRPIPGRPALIVSGNQRDVTTAAELVQTMDVDSMAGTSLALFYPRAVDARTLIREIDAVYGASSRRGGAAPLRLIAIDRLNAVLAIARQSSTLRDVARWVERLDQQAETAETRVFIYSVQYGRAVDLAGVLSRLFDERGGAAPSGQGRTTTSEPSSEPIPPVSLPTNPTLPGGQGEFRPGLQGGPLAAAPPLGGEFPGERRGPPELPFESPADPSRNAGVPTPRIVADEGNNALIVRATSRDYRLIEGALARLDVPPLQILIEAVVAEVTLTNELRYGVQWFLTQGDFRAALSEAASGVVDSRFPGFSILLGGADIRAVLNALESVTRLNVVSSPKLVVLNNQIASLQVGDQVPIATQSAVSTLNPGAPIVNTIQFRDTGVILRVTPRANENGVVRLDIHQEISDVTRTTTSGIDSPTIQQRRFSSSVSVASGETVALAGLIRDRRIDGSTGIPVLRDLPIIGNLFGVTTDGGTRTDLIVLLTPRVIRSPADLRQVTNDLRESLRGPAERASRR